MKNAMSDAMKYESWSGRIRTSWLKIPAVQPPRPGRLLRNQTSEPVDALIKTGVLRDKAFSPSI